MKQQTAVEWLILQIKNDQTDKALTGLEWMKIFEQAKQMEINQSENDYQRGCIDGYGDGYDEGLYDGMYK